MSSPDGLPIKLRPEVAAVTPYRQGVQAPDDGFKLSSNENPFEPLPSVLERVQNASSFNRYGDASALELREKLAAKFGVDIGEVHIASGSVAILYQLVHAAAAAGDEYMFAWPSFEAYPMLGLASGAQAVTVGLTSDYRHDLNAMADAVNDRTRAILLCSPNNPTGPAITTAEFHAFMERVPSDVLVVLDEAYREFVVDPEAVKGEDVIADYPQVVLLRTFSKAYGLAGLRIGYAIGNEQILNGARATGIPLSLTAAAQAGAVASLDAEAELHERIRHIVDLRTELSTRLHEIGYTVADTEGNFVWLGLGDRAVDFADFFAQNGVVVRPFAGYGVRISVGETESIPRVIELASRFKSENVS